VKGASNFFKNGHLKSSSPQKTCADMEVIAVTFPGSEIITYSGKVGGKLEKPFGVFEESD
jgi:hypothetical protein